MEREAVDANAISQYVGDRIGHVLQEINRFWAGEAEVASRYFQSPHTAEEHLHWLTSQMNRELQWPDGRLLKVHAALQQLEAERDRHEVLRLFRVAWQENSHYVLLADIAEKLSGRRIHPDELDSHKALPEWSALENVRTREADWDTAVSGLHEGGGLGIYYTTMLIKPMVEDPIRADIAAAMGLIYNDELEHCASGFKTVVRIASASSDDEWKRVEQKARLVGYHRLRMRNEQFGNPLTEQRIKEIEEGHIVPYLPPFEPVEAVLSQIA